MHLVFVKLNTITLSFLDLIKLKKMLQTKLSSSCLQSPGSFEAEHFNCLWSAFVNFKCLFLSDLFNTLDG